MQARHITVSRITANERPDAAPLAPFGPVTPRGPSAGLYSDRSQKSVTGIAFKSPRIKGEETKAYPLREAILQWLLAHYKPFMFAPSPV